MLVKTIGHHGDHWQHFIHQALGIIGIMGYMADYLKNWTWIIWTYLEPGTPVRTFKARSLLQNS